MRQKIGMNNENLYLRWATDAAVAQLSAFNSSEV